MPEKITHRFLENLYKNAERLHDWSYNKYYDDFENEVWKKYFVPAKEVLIELRYEKPTGYLRKRYNYYPSGDEGEDRIFIKNARWGLIVHLLSGRSSAYRSLCEELFSQEKNRLKVIENKLKFALHDISEGRVADVIEGYDPRKILDSEIKNFGHGVFTFWKIYLPVELKRNTKWGK